MFDFLESDPFFLEKYQFHNQDEKFYGLEMIEYFCYVFKSPENGILYIYIPLDSAEPYWSYTCPNPSYWIQKAGASYINGPDWMQKLIERVEAKYES